MLRMVRIGLALVILLAGTPFMGGKAGAAEKAIQVELEGEKLAFSQPPFMENGTTYVPFRELFQAFGLTVTWQQNEKKIVGTKEGLKIVLYQGSDKAVYNGRAVELHGPVLTRNDATFVPLRFVAEVSGLTVRWEQSAKRIVLYDPDKAKAEALSLLKQYFALAEVENLALTLGLLNQHASFYPAYAEALRKELADYDLKRTYSIIKTSLPKENQAVFTILEQTERTGGAFYVDLRYTRTVTITKNETGTWRISDIRTETWPTPTNLKQLLEKKPDVSQAKLEEASNKVKEYLKAVDDEKFEDAKKLLHPEMPNKDAFAAELSRLAETRDIQLTANLVEVLDYSDTDCYVYVDLNSTRSAGDYYGDNRTESIYHLSKASWQWKLKGVQVLTSKPL